MFSSIKQFLLGNGATIGRVLRWPFAMMGTLADLMLGPRALAIGFFLIVALFSVAPWLRPPISNDLRAIHVTWGISARPGEPPQHVLESPRPWKLTSIATGLLLVAGIGAAVVLVRPQLLPWVAGCLTVLAIGATAAVMLNHPTLIEMLDSEWQQRTMIRNIFGQRTEFLLAGNSGPRVDLLEETHGFFSTAGLSPQSPMRGWMYVVFGPWLVFFCLLTVALSTHGSMARRLQRVAIFCLVGLVFAGGVTWRRWAAEYHSARAAAYENNNRFEEAHGELMKMVRIFPRFGETDRVWLALGRLDYRQGIHTTRRLYYEATQLSHHGQLDHAQALAERVVKTVPGSNPTRNLAGGILAELAKQRYLQSNISSAERTWSDAGRIAPWRYDCRIGERIATAQANLQYAEKVEALLLPELKQIGDRTVRSDLAALIGDAYFEKGDFSKARSYYQLASDIFSLPKYINPHAQERLLGM